MVLRVRTLTPAEHLAFLESRESASFLQTPAWGEVKREWRAESVGWVDAGDEGEKVIGAGLVLYRRLPRMRRSLAYLPEGPVIDWTDGDLSRWLTPLIEHVGAQGAFGIRMGPPVITRRWSAATVKAALAEEGSAPRTLGEVTPDHSDHTALAVADQLRSLGWRPPAENASGFAAGQPRYVFQLPLEDRDEKAVLAGMNQLWRRNIKKATKAGVEVSRGTADDLPAFHQLYVETARRDHFTPRPLAYFVTMFRALNAENPERAKLYLAHHEGELAAATIGVQVGTHAWYSYGASSTAKRDVRPSNALQWEMIRDALSSGARVYDLRGITDTMDESDSHFGLLQFKLGTGGEAAEYLGEWDLPISRLLYSAFDLYMRRRG
ncbi:lipid II:glycine glycyltransferase FemX [Actinopolymorpha singaporensis]|uniref:Lipid II:glycine glycyltransferase (Peptidoglycan interpeptide bridge formation enzyme) n=1 Tax=Actinopolymorpha singaporensis TaxID=117157 RepID=A0A1H1N2X0_9ACTN|nr:peptidoglycan bridge formation glycyltransferase FemA/FemB family protein [Actinopolymorpha singaporensis]SDR93403.1 Lipid II:glycine glycyltransferase (Peptidoglycan interpeptide bridge formation enzyme) [Actinopolymorpha singaporensis]